MKVLFIGYGNMGKALGEAWLKQKVVNHITAIDRHARQDELQATILRKITDLQTFDFDIIVAAVKPAGTCEVLQEIAPQLQPSSLIISVAAGISSEKLQQASQHKVPIVRTIPNTAVSCQEGSTGIYTSNSLTPQQKENINQLFEATGKGYWLETESQLDAITAISGSGIAYYHLFSEALAQVGAQLALPKTLSDDIIRQTIMGAAQLQNQATADFADLRQQVTSPNGTTHAAIQVFEKNNALRLLIEAAAQAAYDRSVELNQN